MTLTALMLLALYGPALVALATAILLQLVLRTRTDRPGIARAVRRWALAGALVAAGIMVAGSALFFVGISLPSSWVAVQVVTPLVAGLVAVVALGLPRAQRTPTGTAMLSRRTPASFADRRWLLALLAVVVAVVALTLAAGVASDRDEQGRYTMYTVDFGSGSVATTFYGWHYSVPALVLLGLLLVAALATVASVARPPLAAEDFDDAAVRRWRTGNILAVTTGALLLHLAGILHLLVGAATISAGFSTGEGWFGAGSPMAVLEAPFRVAATVADVGGWFLWFTVLLAAARAPAPARATTPS